MKAISKDKIKIKDLSIVNEIGFVFEWENRLFRAIRNDAIDRIKALFTSGLMQELIKENLYPDSWMTDYELEGHSLVIEHSKIHPISYPYEWTFSMLKDAALLVLKVNEVATQYGYQLHDCHAFNVVFDRTQPKYVDLGSFVKVDKNYKGFLDYEGFLRSYYYPLKIYSDRNSYLARNIINPQGILIPHESYLLYKYSTLRYIDISLTKKIIEYYFSFRKATLIESSIIRNRFPILGMPVCYLKEKRLLPLQSVNMKSLAKKVQSIPYRGTNSQWSTYHNEYITPDGKTKITFRFDRIIEIIKDYNIETVVELGGNQGVLSNLLIEHAGIKHAVCIDYDKDAVEAMYLSAKEKQIAIYPILQDCMFPILGPTTNAPWQRFKSDIVVALALTHHLILSQSFHIDFILENIAQYTKKYIIIEFMPLGLWDGKSTSPIPEWYTLDWFRESLKSYFEIHIEEKLEENRVLFLGKLFKPE